MVPSNIYLPHRSGFDADSESAIGLVGLCARSVYFGFILSTRIDFKVQGGRNCIRLAGFGKRGPHGGSPRNHPGETIVGRVVGGGPTQPH